MLDDELGTHHGLSWGDFVLLKVVDAAGGDVRATALARQLHTAGSNLLQQQLRLKKIGLVTRAIDDCGMRRVALRPHGSRLLNEARDTVENAWAPCYLPGGDRS